MRTGTTTLPPGDHCTAGPTLLRRSAPLPPGSGGTAVPTRAHVERLQVSSPATVDIYAKVEHSLNGAPLVPAALARGTRRPLAQRSVSDNILDLARRDARLHSRRQRARHSLSENDALYRSVLDSPSEDDDDAGADHVAPLDASRGVSAFRDAIACFADEGGLNTSVDSCATFRTQPDTPSPYTTRAHSCLVFSDDDAGVSPMGRALWSPSGVESGDETERRTSHTETLAVQSSIIQQQRENMARVMAEQQRLVMDLLAMQRQGAAVGPPPPGYGWHPNGWIPLSPACAAHGDAYGGAYGGAYGDANGWMHAPSPPRAPLNTDRRDSSSTASTDGGAGWDAYREAASGSRPRRFSALSLESTCSTLSSETAETAVTATDRTPGERECDVAPSAHFETRKLSSTPNNGLSGGVPAASSMSAQSSAVRSGHRRRRRRGKRGGRRGRNFESTSTPANAAVSAPAPPGCGDHSEG